MKNPSKPGRINPISYKVQGKYQESNLQKGQATRTFNI